VEADGKFNVVNISICGGDSSTRWFRVIMIPSRFHYKPVQSEEELEKHLARIKDSKMRHEEEQELRKLRQEYLEWTETAAELASQGGIIA